MHVDLPSPAEVRSLMEVTGTTCVSIYMPTTPQPVDADAERIAFKNLSSEAVAQLTAAGLDKREVAAFADGLADLGEDPFFWRYQANSLAVLSTVNEVRAYRLANRLEPVAIVGDRFFVKPLLRAVTFPSAGFVLALAQGSVRLYEFGGDYGPIEVEVADLPESMDSFLESVPGAEASEGFGVLSPEGRETRLRKYARQVDRAIRAALRGEDLPVVLAAAEPLASMFRSVSTLPTLADEGLAGNPESVPVAELVDAARAVVDGVHAAEVRELTELFGTRDAQGRGATDLAEIARLATFGAVDVLIVDIDRVVPGIVGDDGAVEFTDAPGSYDVVDEVARRVLLASGRVVAVRADQVPGGGEAAAMLRYSYTG
jgi:hypothetical protein